MTEASIAREAPLDLASGSAAPSLRQSRLAVLLFIALLAAAAVPVFSVRIPALIDFANHLGRLHTMAVLGQDPYLTRFYSVHWKIIPNLGVDILLPIFIRHMSVYLVGKLFVFACMALWLSGAFAIHAALWRRIGLGPLVAFLFVYNFIFFYGFLNYLLGAGLALWGIAAWIALRRSHPLLRGLVSFVFVLVLFACHLFALGVYGLAVLAHEAWRLRTAPAGGRRLGGDVAAFALPFLIVPALLLASPTAGYSLDVKWTAEAKFFGLFYIIKNFNNPLDLAIGLGLAAAALLAWRRRVLLVHPLGWYLLAVSVPVYLAMPDVLFGSWAADRRLPIAIFFVLIGMTRWELSAPAARAAFVAVVVGVALLRFAVVDYYWRWFDHLYAQVEDSFRDIAPGSRILVGQIESPELRYTFRHFLFHAPCLAMIERSSMVPTAFTHPGKQILHVNRAYLQFSDVNETPLPVQRRLVAEARHPDPDPPAGEYWAGWPQKFDYLYIMYQPRPENPLPDLLTPLYQGDEFSLYKIERKPQPIE
ncbi:MAG TPA: hypothetical protein VFA50_21355 [Stellaceae bacterium]|nr:hypothetical protein [Stellaceae bacterium]